MKFKTDRVASEWGNGHLHPLLRRIVSEAANRADQRWEWEFTLTCVYRTEEENDALYGGTGKHRIGVHTDWRGVDVRTRDVDPSAVLDITTKINDDWIYDPNRDGMRVALPEGNGAGSSGAHLHFQVCSMTTRRADETNGT